MGPDGYDHLSPFQQNVRVVPLLFGHGADSVHELQRAGEVREIKTPADMMFIYYILSRDLLR